MGSVSSLQAAQCHRNEQWFYINWKHCSAMVRSLQSRIVKSIHQGAWRKAKRLCYLLTRSFAARAMAVKRVTDNKGKRTAGIDGIKWATPRQKFLAVELVAKWKQYQPKPLRRIRIPKPGTSKTRPLSIPTMEDRARQALLMLALQPIAETLADKNSYGFRSKRSCADAIDQTFKVFRLKGSAQWILEGDIKSFFDTIHFDWILQNIPMNKRVLKAWLECGFIEERKYFPTTQGVPQGGIISPIIGNLVLDGLEKIVHKGAKYRKRNGINFIRYADDFIVTAKRKETLEDEIVPRIQAFLTSRGVSLSPEKTRITHISEGFDFLGKTIRKFPRMENSLGKIQIVPSQRSILSIKHRIKTLCKSSGQLTQAQLIDRLNPILRGWANYHRHTLCGKAFSDIDNYVWHRLMRWAERRHPNKSRQWIGYRYFDFKIYRWIFTDNASGKRLITLTRDIQRFKHSKIKGDANPFDSDWSDYFQNREQMLTMKSSCNYIGKLLKKQQGHCPYCSQFIASADRTQLYFLDGDKTNKRITNVLLLHRHCYKGYEYLRNNKIMSASHTRDVGNA